MENDKMEQAHRIIKEALEPDVEEYLEEEAMEKYYEKKQKSKDKKVCEYCGFEYSVDDKDCPACDEDFKKRYGDDDEKAKD